MFSSCGLWTTATLRVCIVLTFYMHTNTWAKEGNDSWVSNTKKQLINTLRNNIPQWIKIPFLWIRNLFYRDNGNLSWTSFHCVSLELCTDRNTSWIGLIKQEKKKAGVCYRGIGESHPFCVLDAVREWAGAMRETLPPLLFSASLCTSAPFLALLHTDRLPLFLDPVVGCGHE